MNDHKPGLWVGPELVPLKGVQVFGDINEHLTELTVEQTYRNEEPVDIEAVFTFPLPVDAVLLSVSLTLNGKQRSGVVSDRAEAAYKYEKAVSEGDTALLLRQVEDGMYSCSLGNLLPNDLAIVSYRFAQLNVWSKQLFRFSLPTVVAVRDGNPSPERYKSYEAPVFDVQSEYPLGLQIKVHDGLGRCLITSPSHGISVTDEDPKGKLIKLASQEGTLDRDFILCFETIERNDHPFSCWAKDPYDDDSFISLLGLQPKLDSLDLVPSAVSLKIVVDCSCSMAGDSITQAKNAVLEILSELNEADEFSLVKFGTESVRMSERLLPGTSQFVELAQNFVESMQADKGGTNIQRALESAFKIVPNRSHQQVVLLITDGASWNDDSTIELAVHSDHRIHTVGVGSAVSEKLVRSLSDLTGGVFSLVSPNESIAKAIQRQFRLLRQPAVESVVDWNTPGSTIPRNSPRILDGEHTFTFFKSLNRPANDVAFSFCEADSDVCTKSTHIQVDELQSFSADVLARLWANQSIKDSKSQRYRTATAVHYQLITPYTAMFIAEARGSESDGLPSLRRVPQMAAAGHMGFGSTISNRAADDCHYLEAASLLRNIKHADSADFQLEPRSGSSRGRRYAPQRFRFGNVAKLFAGFGLHKSFPKKSDIEKFLIWFNRECRRRSSGENVAMPTIQDFAGKIPESTVNELKTCCRFVDEEVVVGTFVFYLDLGCMGYLSSGVSKTVMSHANRAYGTWAYERLEREVNLLRDWWEARSD